MKNVPHTKDGAPLWGHTRLDSHSVAAFRKKRARELAERIAVAANPAHLAAPTQEDPRNWEDNPRAPGGTGGF